MVSARCGAEQHKHYERAARELGVDLTQLILASLDVSSGRILGSGYKGFRLYLSEEMEIVGIGEVPPLDDSGVPVQGLVVVDLVAKDWFHKKVVSRFSR